MGWSAFGAELVRYLFSAVVLGATIVVAVLAGAAVRKAVDKKKQAKVAVDEVSE